MRDMPGFEADDLMGWIAALGAQRAMGEVTGERVRTVWRPLGGGWRLAALDVDEPSQLARQVTEWVRDQVDAWAWGGFDDVSMGPDAWAAGAREAGGLAAELWCALGSDGCLHRKGKVEASRLEYAQGGGHQHWLGSLRGAVRRLAQREIEPEDIARVLWDVWRRQDQKLVCRWDWRCERDHALMAADPASSAMVMRQDHAATVLAAVGLASLPTAPGRHGLASSLAASDGTLRWPVWTVPMEIADIEVLLGSEALLGTQDHRSARELAARGVGAVMAARRWYAEKLIVFGRGREAARTLSARDEAGRFARAATG